MRIAFTRTTAARLMVIMMMILILVFPISQSGVIATERVKSTEADVASSESVIMNASEDSYDAYLQRYQNEKLAQQEIVIQGKDYSDSDRMSPEIIRELGGETGEFVKMGDIGSMDWEFEVPETGLYHIAVRYFPIEGKSSAIERELLIDGAHPFASARNLTFQRVWKNETDAIAKDNRGNELRPRQVESPMWQESLFRDTEGYYEEPYVFYFSAGKHTLTLRSSREPMVIDYIKVFGYGAPAAYEEVKAGYESKGYKATSGQLIKIQGEHAAYKSSPTLYPISDRSSPATEPYDVSKIRMNTIGGNNWRVPGQWLRWNVDVPEDGLYKIAIKNRQELLRGVYSTRSLWIDGEIPFKEMSQIPFYYDSDWQMNVLGSAEEPYLFYLTKGQHDLKLEVSLGSIAPLIRQVESSLLEINAMYRKILMITGNVPDPYRDYQLDKQIPDMVKVFQEQSDILSAVSEELVNLTGEKSDKTATLNKMAYQLEDMAKKPETVQKRLSQFKINVGSVGAWILQVREQPLEIDYLLLASPDVKLPKADASAGDKVVHEVSSFFYSFFEDYDTIGNTEDSGEAITVWIGTGRDQAQVLKAMIDDTFTPLTDIGVNLKLVNADVLLRASLAGEGPDVAMQVGNEVPVNFGMRNAAEDLSKFHDYESVVKQFRDSAMVPYQFEDQVFALPEQQIFNMLFYRKDILEELNLEPPQTWDDVYAMIPVLQKHHMDLALPIAQTTGVPVLEANRTFAMLLYQHDGSFYLNNGAKSGLDTEIGLSAFKKWTDFYTSYKLPLIFDFPMRFRTGEMPVGIQDYTFYNYLTVSAPEIKGLWEFVPVPGTKQPDGTIRRDVASGGTAAVMLKQAKNKDAAWEFMKWWVSKDTQVRFGREMEGLMGAAARYPTANIEALRELPWPERDYRNLEEQWQWVQGVPEVPGGYFTGRHLDNALREVINNGTNTADALYDYVQEIDYEIREKRDEFNLD
ncbi:extracellular solute-binding protein [Paenibacillus lautus]|uniref:extracellular solute-binding protein n=1 Tax=Paenibacillus lautus TaxID=1401 RepID=UPI002DB9F563|nr:extracellular solute-binding protein [Paenibacillus lautus]MEC0206701.1 extracellular solute-binding protein [Paenibacillus lautus]